MKNSREQDDVVAPPTTDTFELIDIVEKRVALNRAQQMNARATDNHNNVVGLLPMDIWEFIGAFMTFGEKCTTLTSVCRQLAHMVNSMPYPFSVFKLENISNSNGYRLLTEILIQTPDRWNNVKRVVSLCQKDKYTCIVMANLFPNLEIFDDSYTDNSLKVSSYQEDYVYQSDIKIDDVTLAYVAMKCKKIRHIRLHLHSSYLEEQEQQNIPKELTDFCVNKLTFAGVAQIVKLCPVLTDLGFTGYVDQEVAKPLLGLQCCMQCGKFFDPDHNTDTSCLYHPGVYSGYGSSCSSYDCCGSMVPPYPCAQGCKISRHTTQGTKAFKSISGRSVPEEYAFELYTSEIAEKWQRRRR